MFIIARILSPHRKPSRGLFESSRSCMSPRLVRHPTKQPSAERAKQATPNADLRDAQAPGEDVMEAEPEAMLPRHRAPEVSSDSKSILPLTSRAHLPARANRGQYAPHDAA
jgi:hypothetical protein